MTNNGFAAGYKARLRLAGELELRVRGKAPRRGTAQTRGKAQLFERATGEAEPRLTSGGEAEDAP